jgi:glycosyltransferase involved in cell wall biosynthesis
MARRDRASDGSETFDRVSLNPPLPSLLDAGNGTAILVRGCFARPARRLRRLTVTINGRPVKADWRHNTHGQQPVIEFWAVVRLPAHLTEYRIGLKETGLNHRARGTELGVIRLQRTRQGRLPEGPATPASPLVAICMTTYNSRRELLSRQIASIRSQTHQNWTCLISDDNSEPATLTLIRDLIADDDRFHLFSMPDHVGFYRNFERCLEHVPDEAHLIALADHDDYWHPDKLEKLITALGHDDTLVFSDMNIVDEEQRLISKTYWTTRRNNYERLDLLIAANTVSGASAMFRRSLLEYVLPFPDQTSCSFHDHWIAIVALALGTLAYVDEPLYDYVQHGRNVMGHSDDQNEGTGTLRSTLLRWCDHLKTGRKPDFDFWRDVYDNDVLRLRIIAETILLRLEAKLDRRRRSILHRFAVLDRSLASTAWLTARAAWNLAGPNYTVFAENRLLRGVTWKALLSGH